MFREDTATVGAEAGGSYDKRISLSPRVQNSKTKTPYPFQRENNSSKKRNYYL